MLIYTVPASFLHGAIVPPDDYSSRECNASFADSCVGIPRPHMRLVVVSSGQAAIFDAQANNPQSWQMVQPSLNAVLASLCVGDQPAPPPIDDDARRRYAAVAGLYAGIKMKFISDPAHGAGSGGFVPARHFYLFSKDGRVYRAYDNIETPDGNADRFDYDAALAQDPRNTGTYTVSPGSLHLVIGGAHGEPVDNWTVPAPRKGSVTIETVVYTKE